MMRSVQQRGVASNNAITSRYQQRTACEGNLPQNVAAHALLVQLIEGLSQGLGRAKMS